MDSFVEIAAQLVRATRLAYARKGSFLALFAFVFISSTVVLAKLDLLPNAISAETNDTASVNAPVLVKLPLAASATTSAVTASPELPVTITIPSLALSATIANPGTTKATVLDELLLKGAVRYPTSAKLGEDGNVVLFGHSSYLPVVGNQAFKTFNAIQNLKRGAVVTVYSSGTAYTYSVRTVAKESATENVAIPLTGTGKILTLVTCNSFGTKSDRFVVTADLVESHSLGA